MRGTRSLAVSVIATRLSLREALATKQSPQRNSGQAPQSPQKSFIICSTILRNEIATPFGLAMTIILGMRIYNTRSWMLNLILFKHNIILTQKNPSAFLSRGSITHQEKIIDDYLTIVTPDSRAESASSQIISKMVPVP